MRIRNSLQDWFARAPGLCALLVILLAGLTLLGWLSGLLLLASFRSSYIPMAPSTALCFLCVGVGLLLADRRRPWIIRSLAAFVLLTAFAKLIEFFSGIHLGIDERLVGDPAAFGAVSTGRMSPITALNFVLIAIAAVALTMPAHKLMAGPVSAVAALISGFVLIGYLYGMPLLYGGTVIPVALTTALAFFVCAAGLLARAGEDAWPMREFVDGSTRSLLMRYFLPAVVAVTLVSGWVRATVLAHTTINPVVSSAATAIFFAIFMAWIISRVAGVVGVRIDRTEAERNRAKAELVALNNRLEETVRDRTRELEEKNTLMHEELEMARELQLALLPQKFPSIPGDASARDSAVRFLSYYFPTGDVSGDFFSVFPVDDKAIGIFICDVMGHGVRAALVTSMIRALVQEHAHERLDPGTMLVRINRGLVGILEQAGAAMYATGFYLVVDTRLGELRYATAGHPRPFLVRRNTALAEPLQVDGIGGPALGIFDDAVYGTARCPLSIGDLIMLFTDGLFEVEGSEGSMFSEKDLLSTVQRKMNLPPKEFFDEIVGEVRAFSSKNSFDDDVCLVGVEVQKMD